MGTSARSFPSDGKSVREKFSLNSSELKQKCIQKGQTVFTNITSNLESLRNVREEIIAKYIAGNKDDSTNAIWESVILMSQLCERNPDVINVLIKLVDAVQHCLDEKERLNYDEKMKVLRNMMLSVCLTLDFEKILRKNQNCALNPITMPPEDKCLKKFPNFRTIYDLEPIPLKHTSKECDEFSKVWNCKIDDANGCQISTRNSIREFLSVMEEYMFC